VWEDRSVSGWRNPEQAITDPSIVLASFLLDKLKETTKDCRTRPAIAYFFCDDKDESKKTARSLLQGLIHQLISSNPVMVEHAMRCYRTNGTELFTSLANLWEIFIAIVEDPVVSTTYVVLDGIDECEDSSKKYLLRKLSQHFRDIRRSAVIPHVKVLVTSRPHGVIEQALNKESIIRLKAEDEEDNVNLDIRWFLSRRLDELELDCSYHPELKARVWDRLANGADGSFLWVS